MYDINRYTQIGGVSMVRATITISEAARVLGVCRATIYKMIKNDTIHAIRGGNRYLIPTSTLDRYLETGSWKQEGE